MRIRRYLSVFDTDRLPSLETGVLVIGSGVAGIMAAIEAAKKCNVIIVTKEKLETSNTFYAQGGIAVACGRGDSVEKHVQDTLSAAQGLYNPDIVTSVVSEGIERVRELMGWGMDFDRKDGELDFWREGGHSVPRILHSHGDATGRELESVLIRRVRSISNVMIYENTFCVDILTNRGVCLGALVLDEGGTYQVIWAGATILATGGAGQLYRETTNPAVATGDGIGIALRAGALLRDLEFVQFHPTTLYIAGAARELISEAVRGEGGRLVDVHGRRFMHRYHKRAELAPRDVVSRAILDQMKKTGATSVFLDITGLPRRMLKERFSKLLDLCARFKIDPTKSFIPVRPSAHYIIGGVVVDHRGRTNVKNLLACGEVAVSGFHGANRLGSNSLLESLVFGHRAGNEASAMALRSRPRRMSLKSAIGDRRSREIDAEDVKNSIKALMWRDVGIERNMQGLRNAVSKLSYWGEYVLERIFDDRLGFEAQNMLTAAYLIARSALARRESRGVHFRTDFPRTDDRNWRRHISAQLVRGKITFKKGLRIRS